MVRSHLNSVQFGTGATAAHPQCVNGIAQKEPDKIGYCGSLTSYYRNLSRQQVSCLLVYTIDVEGRAPKGGRSSTPDHEPLPQDWAAEAPDLVVFVSGTWVSETGAQE